MEQAQLTYEFEEEFLEKEIGNLIFDVMKVKLDYLSLTIIQEYISTVTNGFSLSFILSYTNDDEKSELYEIIEQMKI